MHSPPVTYPLHFHEHVYGLRCELCPYTSGAFSPLFAPGSNVWKSESGSAYIKAGIGLWMHKNEMQNVEGLHQG